MAFRRDNVTDCLRLRRVMISAVSLVAGGFVANLFWDIIWGDAESIARAGSTELGATGYLKSSLLSGGKTALDASMPSAATRFAKVGAKAPIASVGKAEGTYMEARERRHPVEWNFTVGSADVKARWEAWDSAEGWSAYPRPGVDLSDTIAWPAVVGREGGWRLGLSKPRVVVLSMPQRSARRHQFKRSFEKLCLDANVTWAPALEGSRIPVELKWMLGKFDKKAFDHDKPGMWAIYASHLAIIRDSHRECFDCDLVVFEDDIVFADEFRKRWTEFFTSLPADWDLLRLGGQSLWEPPLKITEHHIRAVSFCNTWGFVVRARSVNLLANRLASLPIRGHWGIDAVFTLFKEFPMYVPVVPMIHDASDCHDTAEDRLHKVGCETRKSLAQASARTYARWPQGYTRTYCLRKGSPDKATEKNPQCNDTLSETCCPYLDPPRRPMPDRNQC
eukprot:TRINITY_DN14402_c0_g1_i2.p1 TRINITY_DN14402_c0_g1~~TRINITY_DN14402_c0_g1_i2.p1  ORF type:complete len:462 (-),score=46.68 TRINITY_DN14402_c0_g1_i2:128-1471(-)